MTGKKSDSGKNSGNKNKVTGKKAASAAGKMLGDPKSTPAQRTVAASDLAQTPNRQGRKGKKKK